MANNKVQLADGTTLIDLTSDTVTPQTMLAGTTAHAANGEQITGVVNLANASDILPLRNEGAASAGILDEYSRADHVHPLGPLKTWTYNNAMVTQYGDYLTFVKAVMDTETDASACCHVPFFADNYTGWPEETNGVAEAYRLGSNCIVIYATTYANHTFTNVYLNDAWTGWTNLHEATYLWWNVSSDFLTWVVSNQNFTNNGSYYCILANTIYTGLPENPMNGTAIIQKRNTHYFVILISTNTNKVYTNQYANAWSGWKELAYITDIPSASSSLPLANNVNGSAGSSNSYSRSDHVHPPEVYAYRNQSSNFLDWVNTSFTSNGSFYVILAHDNFTGLPENENGVAIVYKRNADKFIKLFLRNGHEYSIRNLSNTSWGSWERYYKSTDFDSGSSYCKMPDGTLIQWGYISNLSFNNEALISGTQNFPLSFIDTTYKVFGNGTTTSVNGYLFRVGCSPSTASQFGWVLGSGTGAAITIGGRGFNWMAIGRWK